MKINCANANNDRIKRIKILTDTIFSIHTHLGGKKYHTRIPQFIVPNDSIMIGRMESDEKIRRMEHLVPLAYLLEECFKIISIEKNNCRDKIEKILHRCMVVVDVPKSIQEKLDSEHKFNMPKDWSPETGDVFIRFEKAKISIDGKIKFNDNWDTNNMTWKNQMESGCE